MSDQPTLWSEIWRTAASSALLTTAAWGAAGGLTSALAISGQKRRDFIRQIILGVLTACGLGSSAGAVMSHWLEFPIEAIPVVGVGGGASYLTGVFGPAFFEVILSRLHKGRLPPREED